MKYHVNPNTGRTGQCRAQSPEACEFSKAAGVVIQHYDTAEEAKAAYEKLREKDTTKPVRKKKSAKITQQDIEAYHKERKNLENDYRRLKNESGRLALRVKDIKRLEKEFGSDIVKVNSKVLDQKVIESKRNAENAVQKYESFMKENERIEAKIRDDYEKLSYIEEWL